MTEAHGLIKKFSQGGGLLETIEKKIMPAAEDHAENR